MLAMENPITRSIIHGKNGSVMKRFNKHTVTKTTFVGLTGGINVSQAPEQIGDADMQQCINFVYSRDSNRLTGRDGIGKLYAMDDSIRDIWYDVDTNVLLLFTNTFKAYSYVVGQTPTFIGDLNGSDNPTCAKFQDKIWIASGGHLQYYDYSEKGQLGTVTSSPICNLVFQRFSRLAVSMDGTDGFYISEVGDGTSWTEDTNMSNKEQWLDVGYGDSGTIIGIVPLATDIIFLKSNGKIYQLSGDADPSNWEVTEISCDTDTVGTNCAVNIGNSVIFLSIRGLKTMAAVEEYGNIATNDIGDKFNKLITSNMFEPRVFHLKRHSMLLIRSTSDWTYFVAYNYLVGAATILKFNIPIASICETSNDILVASNNNIYKWSDEYTDDDGKKIDYEIKLKSIIGANKVLLTSIDTKFSADYAGEVELIDGSLDIKVPSNDRNNVKCCHSADNLELNIKSGDRFTVDYVALEVADL
ncbi:hypothetical protein SAMN05660299_00170 [Megasphaera paucivorans]|uniref:Uncharacterized protein n=2 Tax=Megasphaera paucivorans TaxID=349095 RepID=A0A1G9QAI2_9FIRM|nr:hypothetical protein SAMN05660299_00170 [Megasphaera paucivorans]